MIIPPYLFLAAATAIAACGPASALVGAREHLDKPAEWYGGAEGRAVAENVLSWQSDLGGWPKNEDTAAEPYDGDRQAIKPTFDNGATTDELRLLARTFDATGDARYGDAFVKGFDYILAAQYPSGGWPQSHPPGKQYHRHVTFNDGTVVRLMEFLRETHTSPAYRCLDGPRRAAARAAFDRGVECILRCQVTVDGRLTAWCAQHDERDLTPAGGRSYELPSLSGSESVGIVRLLMSIEDPSPAVVRSVEAAVAWFEAVQITGTKVVVVDDSSALGKKDRRVVDDPGATRLWARFYEIGTDRPMFADRDGVVKYELSAIGHERRNGYAWLGDWPGRLLAREYPAWKERLAGR